MHHASGRHPQMQFFQPRAESGAVSVGTEKDWLQEDLVHPHHEVEDGIALPSSHLVDDPRLEAFHFLSDPLLVWTSLQDAVAVCEEVVDNSHVVDVEDIHETDAAVEDPKQDHHKACTGHQGVHKA